MKNEKLIKNLPDLPGVYLMKDKNTRVLYVGKAVNLKRRVSSYFQKASILRQNSSGPRHDTRIEKLVSEIADIETRTTDSALEALILESRLIKELEPPYNIREKDDKSFLYIEITKEKFPRVLLVRGKDKDINTDTSFGPFVAASSLREAMKILRRIFPWSTHITPMFLSSLSPITSNLSPRLRPCFEYELGLCPGTCIGVISRGEYRKNINNLKLFLKGEKARIISSLSREMETASKKLDFERAAKTRKQIFALQHIHDTALISENDHDSLSSRSSLLSSFRIEGYDISNISGTSAVGSMVVFINGEPVKSEYRKFKIRSAVGKNPVSSAGGDVGMMKEMLQRRLENKWELPNLILVDGGAGQVRVAKNVLEEFGLQIPVVGIAKGPERKRNDVIGFIPKGIDKQTLIHVRDEAHRFAISYHKNLRGKAFLFG